MSFPQPSRVSADVDAEPPLERYHRIRSFTEHLCATLETEDYVIQSMDDVSPTRWHLAHTSWFFETFILTPHMQGYETPDPIYNYLFNSYYNAVGRQFHRPRRGLLSRPTVKGVYDYRAHIDRHMKDLLGSGDVALRSRIAPVLEVGLNHEQQHQELMLTDIKHVFSCNPINPVFRKVEPLGRRAQPGEMGWMSWDEDMHDIGHEGTGFAYDNESPRHRAFVPAFKLSTRLVTNGEFKAFMADDGYRRSELWLSEGWATVQRENWNAPLYWDNSEGPGWQQFTLSGLRDVDDAEPVCHVSLFEADAFARWAGARLPTEFEWEAAAARHDIDGNFVGDGALHPAPTPEAPAQGRLGQLFGDVWEWTQSHYSPYPGYRPAEGAIGEYNGKFMCNQFVLRGGSCATSRDHIRKTYRNFFPAHSRWQFTGIRLASEE